MLRQQDDEAVIGMIPAGVDQFDMLTAQIDAHAIGKREVWNRRRGIGSGENLCAGGLVAHKQRLTGKNPSTRNMVVVMVAIDHVAHRLSGQLCNLRFQPGRGFQADRIGDDHALRRHDKDGLVALMPEKIDVFCQCGDFIGRAWRLRGDATIREE